MLRPREPSSIFSKRLKQARQDAGLSQKELGILAGLDLFVASTRINRYEKGIHEPDMATIARLAATLKVPTAYLFAEDERLARMIRAFSALDAVEQDRLLRAIERP
ncbi:MULTISPECIES: helix-turn-helix domain-containing protein [unclassified Rhodanobacter]|uniref:Helix-turn-helix domain-containing protein n=1 Tax=Rhodanobacter humi TaxID=1888173 RepID=A0ABV4AW98_9GAMM